METGYEQPSYILTFSSYCVKNLTDKQCQAVNASRQRHNTDNKRKITMQQERPAQKLAYGEMQYAITLKMKYKCHYAQFSEKNDVSILING